MFGIVRKIAARQADLSDVESWLIGNSLRFAAEITGQFKEVPPVMAATEGLSFFLHALRREVFKPTEFRAWESIFEPARKQLLRVFAMTVAGWSNVDLDYNSMVKDIENMTSMRNLEYSTLPFLDG